MSVIDPRVLLAGGTGYEDLMARFGMAPPQQVQPPQGSAMSQAYQLAGAAPLPAAPAAPTQPRPFPAAAPLAPSAATVGGGGGDAQAPNTKFAGAGSGALAGWQIGGPVGALVGGIAGYALNGGAKDLDPRKASGFTGITMDQAWEDQNLARLGSNPAAALATKLGVDPHSWAGKLLDPVAGFQHGTYYKEEGIRDNYYDYLEQTGSVDTRGVFDPRQFYESMAGEFRGNHSKYAPRASGAYGKKDEDKFVMDLANKINSAYEAGTIGKRDTAQSIFDKVVDPWFKQDFGGWHTDDRYPNLVADHKAMTVDLISRYISGSPVDWGVITGENRSEFPVPKYVGGF